MDNLAYDIRVLMRELNLNNVCAPSFELENNPNMSNLEYLEYVLSEEQRMRVQKKYERRMRQGNIPLGSYDKTVNGINKEQLNRILTLGFTHGNENLIIIGQCRTGKTALAATLAESLITQNEVVYYVKLYDLLEILANKSVSPAGKRKYDYMMTSKMVIVDEFLYTSISNSELVQLFRFLSALNECASIVIITNRYLDEWLDAAEDEFQMQTLMERLLGNCEVFRTQALKEDLLPERTPKRKPGRSKKTRN